MRGLVVMSVTCLECEVSIVYKYHNTISRYKNPISDL
jgi:hypothetical protein